MIFTFDPPFVATANQDFIIVPFEDGSANANPKIGYNATPGGGAPTEGERGGAFNEGTFTKSGTAIIFSMVAWADYTLATGAPTLTGPLTFDLTSPLTSELTG